MQVCWQTPGAYCRDTFESRCDMWAWLAEKEGRKVLWTVAHGV